MCVCVSRFFNVYPQCDSFLWDTRRGIHCRPGGRLAGVICIHLATLMCTMEPAKSTLPLLHNQNPPKSEQTQLSMKGRGCGGRGTRGGRGGKWGTARPIPSPSVPAGGRGGEGKGANSPSAPTGLLRLLPLLFSPPLPPLAVACVHMQEEDFLVHVHLTMAKPLPAMFPVGQFA